MRIYGIGSIVALLYNLVYLFQYYNKSKTIVFHLSNLSLMKRSLPPRFIGMVRWQVMESATPGIANPIGTLRTAGTKTNSDS